jgi:hypothetical protein
MGLGACRVVSYRPRIVPPTYQRKCGRYFSRPTASEKLITCAGARHNHGHPTPSVYRRRLSHAAQEQRLPLPQRAGEALSWVGNHSPDNTALPPNHLTGALPHIIVPATRMCGRRQRRPRQQIFPAPGRPQGGTPPSLRPRTSLCHHPAPSTTPTSTPPTGIASADPWRSGTTVTAVTTILRVAVPELPIAVIAPALDAPIVLRSAASLMHSEDGAWGLQGGFLHIPNGAPKLSTALRASCLATYGF